jgi:hypothetical protein
METQRRLKLRNILIGATLIVVGFMVFIIGVNSGIEDSQVKKNGEQTSAAVVDKGVEEETDSDGDKSERYWLGLKFFDLKQGEHNAKRTVDKDDYDKTKIGDMIEVKYLPEKPEVVRLLQETEGDPMIITYALGIIGSIIGVLGIFCIITGIKQKGANPQPS